MTEERTSICTICGKSFTDHSNKGRKYCSVQCQRKGQVTEAKLSAIKTRQKDNYTRKKFDIQIAYDQKCAVCGWQLFNPKTQLRGRYSWGNGCEVHHIVSVKDGGTNKSSNLILLCPNCHKMAHAGIHSVDFLKSKTIDTEAFFNEAMANNTCSEAVSNAIFG